MIEERADIRATLEPACGSDGQKRDEQTREREKLARRRVASARRPRRAPPDGRRRAPGARRSPVGRAARCRRTSRGRRTRPTRRRSCRRCRPTRSPTACAPRAAPRAKCCSRSAPRSRPASRPTSSTASATTAYIARGGYPSTLDYKGYPKSLCTSVNEVICHGIPDDRPLQDGDIVNCDVTIYLHGVHGDCSETFLVGDVDDVGRRLVQTTYESSVEGHRRGASPAAASTRSGARSRRTPRPTGSASCARSSVTVSARRSTPRRRSRTSTTRTPTR